MRWALLASAAALALMLYVVLVHAAPLATGVPVSLRSEDSRGLSAHPRLLVMRKQYTLKHPRGQSRKIFSQNGEDGVLERAFELLGFGTKRYVEFGTEQCSECNTRYLREKKGWTGLLMDGGHENAAINLHKEMIYPTNIVELFSNYSVPQNLDLLSIDVDSTDLWLWHALLKAGYRARVVVIEFNRNFPSGISLTCQPDGPRKFGTKVFGASITALEIVAAEFNYKLFFTDTVGVNAYFVNLDICADAASLPSWLAPDYPPLHHSTQLSCNSTQEPHLVVYLGNGQYRPICHENYLLQRFVMADAISRPASGCDYCWHAGQRVHSGCTECGKGKV